MPSVSTVEPDAQLAIARELWRQDRPADAEAVLRDVVATMPRREDASMLLAEVLRSQGCFGAASEALRTLCRANGFEPGLGLRAAQFVRQCDRHRIAGEICERALSRQAAPPAELLALAGHIARESGDFETARRRYLAALDAGIDLERHHVLSALANTRRYTDAGDQDLARCEAHFRSAAYSARSRASAGFGLAKIRNDLGDYASAARVLREANALVHGVQPWDVAAWQRFVEARTRDRAAPAVSAAGGNFVPVFVLGIPRSGTTLTASLLARATGARDRGESRALRFIADQLVAGGHLENPAALAEAANLYRTLAVQDDAPAGWYIDQDPLNFRYLDIAAAMFPQARVIHLRREARDTALSLWSQDFAHADMAFAYDFGDMAAYMAGHDMLMQHWKHALRVPIHELDYETLVTDTDVVLAALREFIGAPAGASRPSAEGVPVQSASVWQARQPVYRTSVGRWRHYAPYVPELARFGREAGKTGKWKDGETAR
ncbi:MAG TPA: sulfotransferase [Rhodanobacteraceae bacterium]|nr:sulfotransferase [Rhodanobacteraceae bacterium]